MSTSRTREKADGELFKSTGIDDNATSTAVTIDASENVGVGQTSPITKLDASQDNIGGNVALGIFQSGNAYGNVASSASLYLGATYHSLANSAKITSTHSSGTTGNHAQDLTFNPINSGSTSFEAMRIDSGGRAIIGGGVTLGNGQTYAAANTLDDYEEGTWTPVLKFDNNNVGMVFSGQAGFYTKVGNLVTANSYYSLSNKGSSNGAAVIHGLPFAVANITNNYVPVSLGFSGVNFADMLIGYVDVNGTKVNLREVSNAGSHTTIVQSNVADSGDMMMSVTYRTA